MLLSAGLGLVVAAPAVSWWLSAASRSKQWSIVIDEAMTDRPGVWRVMRGGFAYLTIPALFLLLAVLLLAMFRRSRRDAWVLAGVALVTNVSVQLIKLAPLGLEQGPAALNPLSGHVGVAAGVCFGWLAVAPPAWRRLSRAVAAAILVVISSGVMLAGWHSPVQVLCPLLLGVGWGTAGAAFLPRLVAPQLDDVRWGGSALIAGVVVVGATTTIVLFDGPSLFGSDPASVAMATVWATGWCLAAVGFVTLTRAADPAPRSSLRDGLESPE